MATPEEKLTEISQVAMYYRRRHPKWRQGQAAFNALNDFRPEIAEKVRGSQYDPFFDDNNLAKFWDFVFTELRDTP